jgi:hypothetical protein
MPCVMAPLSARAARTVSGLIPLPSRTATLSAGEGLLSITARTGSPAATQRS